MMNVIPITDPTATPTPEPEIPADFATFYAVYPRHEARKDALKAWNGLSAEDQQAAIEGALAWRKVYLTREVQHRPLPATWLRGERWTDELPTAVVSTQQAAHALFDPVKPVAKGGWTPEIAAKLKAILGKRA